MEATAEAAGPPAAELRARSKSPLFALLERGAAQWAARVLDSPRTLAGFLLPLSVVLPQWREDAAKVFRLGGIADAALLAQLPLLPAREGGTASLVLERSRVGTRTARCTGVDCGAAGSVAESATKSGSFACIVRPRHLNVSAVGDVALLQLQRGAVYAQRDEELSVFHFRYRDGVQQRNTVQRKAGDAQRESEKQAWAAEAHHALLAGRYEPMVELQPYVGAVLRRLAARYSPAEAGGASRLAGLAPALRQLLARSMREFPGNHTRGGEGAREPTRQT